MTTREGPAKEKLQRTTYHSGQLLEHLDCHSQQDSVSHAWTSEYIRPLSAFSTSLLFFQFLSAVFYGLIDNFVILTDSVKSSNIASCKIVSSISEVEARRLGKEQNTNTKDDSPQEANTEHDPPGTGVVDTFRAEVDQIGKENANGDKKLVAADDSTTNV